jgi:zinc and cadmium transporter
MLSQTYLYTISSVLLVSLISLIGILTLSINTKKLKRFLIFLISFSAGTLLGDAFLHLLPEITKGSGLTIPTALYILLGITIFFILEKGIHWQHCHTIVLEEKHIHPFAYTNMIGDSLHNFIDGIIIASSYLISIPVGIATTIAVILHEIPQEIGDYGVLIHGGFTKTKALFINFISAIFAILGAVLTLFLKNSIVNIEHILVPIAIGGFIYIASSDLIPEIHKHSNKFDRSFFQLLAFILGIVIMALLLFLD